MAAIPCLALLVFISLMPSSSSMPIKFARRVALEAVREVNQKGPYLGLVTVYDPEEAAFFNTKAFVPDGKRPYVHLSGRRFRIGNIYGKRVIYVRCGIGLVNAASATQQMLDMFDITGVVHFGIAGNANDSMAVGDVTIPKEFIQTGLWDWLRPNATLGSSDIAYLDVKNYNQPQGASNQLGRIAYSTEQFFSVSGEPNVPEALVWAQVTESWLHLATKLEGIELQQCLNSTLCLEDKPKLVVGLRASTAHTFVDNEAYRNFLFTTFNVSSLDMESAAIVMTCLSNGFPVLVIRGLSDLAGADEGVNQIGVFGSLAAQNVAKAVIQFVKIFPQNVSRLKNSRKGSS